MRPIVTFRAHATRFVLALAGCASSPTASDHKAQVVALLKSFETGDASALAVIDPNRYIQHNLGAADGIAGLQALLATRPPGSVKVNTVRVFEDGDLVVAHTEYAFPALRASRSTCSVSRTAASSSTGTTCRSRPPRRARAATR